MDVLFFMPKIMILEDKMNHRFNIVPYDVMEIEYVTSYIYGMKYGVIKEELLNLNGGRKMSYKNGYEDNKACNSDREASKCKLQHEKIKSILLECGEGSGSRVFTTSDDTPFQIAHVTADISSLKKAKVLIKFSSSVGFEGEFNGTIRLKYELLRVCGVENPLSLAVQMYEKINGDLTSYTNTEDSFAFVFCDRVSFTGCCEYFVTVTPIEISDARATVMNGKMALLAQSS